MNKKEILTLIAIGLVIFFVSCFGALLIVSPNNGGGDSNNNGNPSSSPTQPDDGTLKVDKYTLHYGNYYCEYEEYEDGKLVMYEATLKLEKDKIIIGDVEYTYTINGDEFKLQNGPIMRAINDDRIRMEAGAGLEYNYKEAK